MVKLPTKIVTGKIQNNVDKYAISVDNTCNNTSPYRNREIKS